VKRGHIDRSSTAKTLRHPDNFSALVFPRHFQVPGSTQEFPARTSASMMNILGRDRQIISRLDCPERERRTGREAVCACWRMQEPVPGMCVGGSILSVCVEIVEDFNILFFKPFSPCWFISCHHKPKLTRHAPVGHVGDLHAVGNRPPAGYLQPSSCSKYKLGLAFFLVVQG